MVDHVDSMAGITVFAGHGCHRLVGHQSIQRESDGSNHWNRLRHHLRLVRVRSVLVASFRCDDETRACLSHYRSARGKDDWVVPILDSGTGCASGDPTLASSHDGSSDDVFEFSKTRGCSGTRNVSLDQPHLFVAHGYRAGCVQICRLAASRIDAASEARSNDRRLVEMAFGTPLPARGVVFDC